MLGLTLKIQLLLRAVVKVKAQRKLPSPAPMINILWAKTRCRWLKTSRLLSRETKKSCQSAFQNATWKCFNSSSILTRYKRPRSHRWIKRKCLFLTDFQTKSPQIQMVRRWKTNTGYSVRQKDLWIVAKPTNGNRQLSQIPAHTAMRDKRGEVFKQNQEICLQMPSRMIRLHV